jgi:hypothetical protein
VKAKVTVSYKIKLTESELLLVLVVLRQSTESGAMRLAAKLETRKIKASEALK